MQPSLQRAFAKVLCCVSVAVCVTMPVGAQTAGSEIDKAFWCVAAYAVLKKQNAYASAAQEQATLADVQRFGPVMEAEGKSQNWTAEIVKSMALSYEEEVSMQMPDYLKWKDASALRYPLSECFPSAGF